jgi:hypothetical protein
MEINETEAREILSYLNTTRVEIDDELGTDLEARIFEAFPAIKQARFLKEKHDYLWSVTVEQDGRVIAARAYLDSLDYKNRDAWELALNYLHTVKGLVLEEIEEETNQ